VKARAITNRSITAPFEAAWNQIAQIFSDFGKFPLLRHDQTATSSSPGASRFL
jgi:hypothetical protein